MKDKSIGNKEDTKRLNNLQSYEEDMNIYFICYMAGVIVLAIFLNLCINTKSTDEYYEKYYVLEDYENNYKHGDEELEYEDR